MKSLSETLRTDDYIQEGANPGPGVLVLACTVGEDYDNPKNRILLLRDDSWLDFSSSGDSILSVDATAEGAAYVLSENGSVIQFDWRTPMNQADLKKSRKLFANTRASSLGPLRRIRVVGDDIFCGGSRGQVYWLRNGRFEALPRLTIDGEEVTVEDLCGTSHSNLTVVTSDGYGARFDGSTWHKLDLPSNTGLNSICRIADGRYFIAGDNSTLIVGEKDEWDLVAPIDSTRNYYGVGALGTNVFVAYLGGIDVFDGYQLRPLILPDDEQLEFTVLREGSDGVWSFVGHTVGVISSSGWRKLP